MILAMMIMTTNDADGKNDDAIDSDDNDDNFDGNYHYDNDNYNDYNDDNRNDGVGGLWEPDGGRGRPVSPIIYFHTLFATGIVI